MKRFERVLLINPSYPHSHYPMAFRPLAGLGYISQALEDNGIEYNFIDLGLGYNTKDLNQKIYLFKPDLIGISMMTFKYANTYLLMKKIKDSYHDIKIVTGGAHISTLREKVLLECPSIDYGVVLEGEESIVELCQGKEIKEIKGLIYRNEEDGQILYNGDRPFNKELDKISFPRYNKFELSKYTEKEIPIVSSRGCPYNCIYCPVSLAIGKKLRVRSPEGVVTELEYWYNKGYRRFDFVDDNFTFYKERIYEICNGIEKRGFKNLGLHCGNGLRADKVDMDLLKKMKSVGFNYLAFGVEAGNNKVLKALRKSENIDVIEKAIKEACDLGIDVSLFFLVGSPEETLVDFEESISLAKRYPVKDVRFYNIIPYPNTELYDWIDKNNYFLKTPESYLNDASSWKNDPIFRTPQMSKEDKKKALKYGEQIRRKIRRKSIERKLNRYGLLGKLGAYLYISNFYQNNLSAKLNPLIRRIVKKKEGKGE
ncbi:MAG: radical SAM protein [bacterium]|nr:radical SAM protein [bacterium]